MEIGNSKLETQRIPRGRISIFQFRVSGLAQTFQGFGKAFTNRLRKRAKMQQQNTRRRWRR